MTTVIKTTQCLPIRYNVLHIMCVGCKYTITSRQDIMHFTVYAYIIDGMLSYGLRASDDPSILVFSASCVHFGDLARKSDNRDSFITCHDSTPLVYNHPERYPLVKLDDDNGAAHCLAKEKSRFLISILFPRRRIHFVVYYVFVFLSKKIFFSSLSSQ